MITELINDILGYVVIGSSILPITFFICLRLHKPILLKIYFIELLLVNLSNLFLFKFTSFNQNNFFLIHIFLEFTLVLFTIQSWNIYKKKFKQLLRLIFTINALFFLFVVLLYPSEVGFGLYGFFSKVILSILAMVAIYDRYNNSKYYKLLDDPKFNFASAFIVYNGTQIYIMIFDHLVRKELSQLFFFVWTIMQLATISYHFLLVRATWKLKS